MNPYTRLRNQVDKFKHNVINPRRMPMWHYPKKALKDGWELETLYERVAAAKQLGFRVEVVAREDGLFVEYVENTIVPYFS